MSRTGNYRWGYCHSEETKRKFGQALRGHVLSEEARRKISEAMKGRKPWNLGKHWSDELKEKFRKGSMGNKNHLGFRHVCSEETKRHISLALRGDKNPAWLGGVSFEPYGKEFNDELRARNRKRDGYTCQICGTHQSKLKVTLNVHHIDYDKTNNGEENLVSLCVRCHTLTNTNRDFWKGFFQQRLLN